MIETFDLRDATILIVDDQPDNLRLVADFLENYGVDVMLGHDGADGLVKAKLGQPDLILLDVMMPDMDGFVVCRRLKQESLTREIPVIFLTALNEVEDKLKGFQAGGVDFLSKPLQELEVVARVDVHIKLYRARQRAEAAARAKSEFLANMNHEIRTPMNAVLGYASLLQEAALDRNSRSYLDAIQSAGKTLLKLIDNILDLSRIDSGKLELDIRPTDVRSLLSDTARMFAPKAREKGVLLQTDVADVIPRVLLMDETRIRQILLNLVGNAVKFTHEGVIHVSVNGKQLDNQDIELQLQVRDSGIGISADQLGAVFEAFTQQRGQSHADYGGTGLGLAICARLADLMGGEIRVESELEKGSVFTVVLPRISRMEIDGGVEEDGFALGDIIRYEPARIVVADDDPASRKLLIHMLTLMGFAVSHAENGRQALALVREQQPDLLLTDLTMPELNGEEVARKLKQDADNAAIAVVAVTASVVDESDHRLGGNFDGVLIKPVTRQRLTDVLSPFIRQRGAEKKESQSAKPSSGDLVVLPDELQDGWRRIQGHPSINEVEEFAAALRQSGEAPGMQPLLDWADQLSAAADRFDPKAISDVLTKIAVGIQSTSNP